jgi:hypothetical protein
MYVETVDDLNRKYQHSFIKIGDDLVYFAGAVNASKDSIHAIVSREGAPEQEVDILPDTITELELDATMFNGSDLTTKRTNGPPSATVFRRSPLRQWKRGLTDENTLLECPVRPLYRSMGRKLRDCHNKLTFPLVKKLYYPVYPEFREAITLCKRHIAVAISPLFAVMLSNISADKYLIASLFGYVAEADETTIWVRHKPAAQELTDYIKRTNQPINLEVTLFDHDRS